MATTFTEAKATLDGVADMVNRAKDLMAQGRSKYGQAKTILDGLATQYSDFIADIDAAAAADAWPQADSQKAEKDQMVADRNTLKTKADATVTAIDAV